MMVTSTPPYRLTDLLDAGFMARLDNLDVLSRKILRGKLHGERRSKRRGQSVEFADHRPYVAGDDLRFVDWNIYGRLEQLFLKLFLEEQDLTVHVAFDASASMAFGDPDKFDFARKLTAALAYVGLGRNNRVTVSAFGAGLQSQLPNLRGRHWLGRFAEWLLTTRAAGPGDFDLACRHLASNRIGSGVMVIISDFLFKEGYQQGLRRLVSPAYDLYAIQVLAPQELRPELTGDLKLIDVEDDNAAEITAGAALLKYYRQTLHSYCHELKTFCTRRGGVHVLAGAADPVETVVLDYLRRIRLLT